MKSLFRFLMGGGLLILNTHLIFAQPQLNVRVVSNDLEVFFLKDFDINNPSVGPPLFFIDIINNQQVQNVRLILKVRSEKRGNLASGETRPFVLQPFQTLTISNNDLFSDVGDYRLESFRIQEDVLNDLLQDVLATGRLPTDTYQFEVQLKGVQNPITIDDEQFEIDVSNPNTLDLIFPGQPATGTASECPEIYTNLPQFRWESDMKRFLVIIAEARAGEDPESALNQEPRFLRTFIIGDQSSTETIETTSETGKIEFIPSPSFQYPAFGEVLTLKPGRTYYWRVIGLVKTSSGLEKFKSEIYCFRIADLDQTGSTSQRDIMVLRLLNSLGIDTQQLFGEGGALEGYHATRIYYNGRLITMPELLRKINEIRSNYTGYKIENQ